MRSMSKLALVFVGTKSIFDKLFTQLTFLFILVRMLVVEMERFFRVTMVTRRLGVDCGSWRIALLIETLGSKRVG